MNRFAVIVAGGTGQRFGSTIPKQFLLLNGQPVLMHSISKFFACCKKVVVVLPEDYLNHWESICHQFKFELPLALTTGGSSRSHSVWNGLNQINEEGLVAVHDAARPLVSDRLIEHVFSKAAELGNAVPCIRLSDSLRYVTGNRNKSVNRNDFRLIQTPQCFSVSALKNAFLNHKDQEFSDEASLMEKTGETIHLIEGEYRNFKITSQADLSHAEIFFKQKDV
jgi:2-C-methyl-D-erythritol 4-phosphate cytidylyltransferase